MMNASIKKFVIFLVLLMSFITSAAYDIKVDGIYYNVTVGDNPICEVTYGEELYSGFINVPMEISYKGRILPVTGIGSMAFNGCIGLMEIHIPESIKSIGWRAFDHCSELTIIDLPTSIELIDGLAFSDCSSLTSVVIPERVTEISLSTFAGCSSLTEIDITSNITKIGSSAFEGCNQLREISIPSSVIEIGNDAFDGCYNIHKLNIENASDNLVLHLEPYNKKTPFGKCLIEEICLGRDISYMQDQFYGAQPTSAKGDYTLLLSEFKKNLTKLTIGGSIQNINLQNGYLNDKFDKLEAVIISQSVSTIYDSCFAKCISLRSVSLANSVNYIMNSAFNECPELMSIMSYNPEPPQLESNVFTSNTFINGVLYVPGQAIRAYKEADGWKNFWEIKSIDEYTAGMENIAVCVSPIEIQILNGTVYLYKKSDDAIVRFYTPHGVLIKETTEHEIQGLPSGLYIVTVDNHSFKVML